MSATATLTAAGSLSDQIAARRRARAQKRSGLITIPVPGYEDLLHARYRRLDFEEKSQIAKQHEGLGDNPDEEVAAAADMLLRACEDLLQPDGVDERGKPAYVSLGKRWTGPTIVDIFQLDEMPENVTARVALRAALGGEDLMDHFLAYMRQANDLDAADREDLPGESKPSVEG